MSMNHGIAVKIAAFCRERERLGASSGTIAVLRVYARQFLQWYLQEHTDERYATTADLLMYRGELQKSNRYRQHTINCKLRAIMTYYRYLVAHGKAARNPVTRECIGRSHMVLIHNVLPVDKMEQLLEGISLTTHYGYLAKCVAEAMYSCGLRISECLGLKQEDIEWESGYLRVIDSKRRIERRVPIGDVALYWLKRYRGYAWKTQVRECHRAQGYLFPQYKNAAARVTRWLQRECLRMGLPVITPHCFRHSCATHLLQKGATVKQVQEFLGHASIKNTQIYTHIMKADLCKVVAQCHPRGDRWGS